MTDQATVEPAASGLLDNVQVEDKTQAANPQAADISHKADGQSVDTGAPKTKPDYLPDNFWDAEKGEAKHEALAKSWTDLRKTISQGKHKAPEDGQYDTSVLAAGIDAAPLTEYAKKWGLSQAAFEELAAQSQQLAEQAAGPAIDPAAEMKQLGPNANAILEGMVNWGRGLVNKGVWSADDFEEFKIMGGTARGINALMKIREAYEGRVPVDSIQMEGAPSKEELYAMVNDPKYKTDAAYRQKVERMFQQNIK